MLLYYHLVGGLEHFLFFHILGIIVPTDELQFLKRGRYTTNQYHITIILFIYYYYHYHITILPSQHALLRPSLECHRRHLEAPPRIASQARAHELCGQKSLQDTGGAIQKSPTQTLWFNKQHQTTLVIHWDINENIFRYVWYVWIRTSGDMS